MVHPAFGKTNRRSGEIISVNNAQNQQSEKVLRVNQPSRILLVEDNEVNAIIAGQFLSDLNLQYELANNGFVAIKKTDQQKYDLILMDMQMPIVDGLSATREIRKSEGATQHVPIIAMTANILLEDQKSCFEAGMDDYISKPINLDILKEKLVKWLPDKLSFSELKSTTTSDKVATTMPDNKSTVRSFDLTKALEIVQGQMQIVKNIIAAFIKEEPKYLERLKVAIDSSDPVSTRLEAHTVKSASAYIGADQLNVISKSIEDAARAGDMDTCRQLFVQFEKEISELTDSLLHIHWDTVQS